jgi:choline dehydrogenase-like flavoprotein
VDFARRDWVPLSGWPICADTLRPYQEEIFDIVGLHRPFEYDSRVWEHFEKTPPAVDDSLLEYSAFQFGKNLGLGEVFRRALEQAPNVTVYLHANALGLRPTERGDHVDHVDVGALSGQRYTVRADRYVLASGGIENPRLLLLSDSWTRRGSATSMT